MLMRLILIVLSFGLAILVTGQKNVTPITAVYKAPLGEHLEYKLHYGWFPFGEASVSLNSLPVNLEGEGMYFPKIAVSTEGIFSWFAGINDEFYGHIRKQDFKPVKTEKHERFKKGLYEQWNEFDYDSMIVDVRVYADYYDTPNVRRKVAITDDTYDIVGTYMYLRHRKWEDHVQGDSLMVKTFYEKKLYDLGLEFAGQESIKYQGVRMNARKYFVLFPLSDTFSKPHAVAVWIVERDGVNIPLKIEAQMKIGKVYCELDSYKIQNMDRMDLIIGSRD